MSKKLWLLDGKLLVSNGALIFDTYCCCEPSDCGCYILVSLNARIEGPSGVIYNGPIDAFTEYEYPSTLELVPPFGVTPGHLRIRADAPQLICDPAPQNFVVKMVYDFPPFFDDASTLGDFNTAELCDSRLTSTVAPPGDPVYNLMEISWCYELVDCSESSESPI